MSKADSIRDTVVAGCDKKRKKLSALRKEAKEAQASGSLSEEEALRLTVRLDEADSALQQARRLRPVTGSLFIRLFLGSVNVKVSHEEDRKKLKEEYNKFKSRTNFREPGGAGEAKASGRDLSAAGHRQPDLPRQPPRPAPLFPSAPRPQCSS